MGKANLHRDFKELLESLNSAKVKYLLLGGYAVNFYGYRRATDDMDIWILTDDENAAKVSQVLQTWGGFSRATVKPSMFTVPHKVFVFGREPVRVDLLTSPTGVTFEDCYKRRKQVNLDGIAVPMIAFDDLLTNKKASGRAKDLADVDHLTRMQTARKRSRPRKKLP